ncbi:MAG: helix-turn-helix domain-containing protein [Cyanobacteria bacterium HKST-UBA02]|nr:helix-turn-helix domain-containing protein [Cyanobacteria bacterium HKST-UBA02]
MTFPCVKVFTDRDFYEAFVSDLSNAKARVIFQSPFVAIWRFRNVRPHLQRCIERGVTVCAFLQEPEPNDDHTVFDMGADSMRSAGIHVTVRIRNHEKLAVIDEAIFWDGSLNILSHSRTSDRMTRWLSRAKVDEEIERYKLTNCIECRSHYQEGDSPEALGELIGKRRRALGLKQKDLAPSVQLGQEMLSRVETGRRALSIEAYGRLARKLKMRVRLVPECLLPYIDKRIAQVMDVDLE